MCLPAPVPFPVLLSHMVEHKGTDRSTSWYPVWLIGLPQSPPELDFGVRPKLLKGFLGPSKERDIFSSSFFFFFLSSAGGKAAHPSLFSTELPPSTSILSPTAAFHGSCQVAMPIRFPWLLGRAAAFQQAGLTHRRRKGDQYCPRAKRDGGGVSAPGMLENRSCLSWCL